MGIFQRIFFIFQFIFCLSAMAVILDQVKSFTPGNYHLAPSGPMDKCGEGKFGYGEERENIELGPFHGFRLKSEHMKLPGDAPGDEGCNYESDLERKNLSDKTVFSYWEIRRCAGEQKYKMTKEAVVSKGQVVLKFIQTGENPAAYTCTWNIKK